jgi:aspartate--ammonia ligase
MIQTLDRRADLAGPGIGNYDEIEKILPDNYSSLLDPKETQIALGAVKRYIEDRKKNIFVIE